MSRRPTVARAPTTPISSSQSDCRAGWRLVNLGNHSVEAGPPRKPLWPQVGWAPALASLVAHGMLICLISQLWLTPFWRCWHPKGQSRPGLSAWHLARTPRAAPCCDRGLSPDCRRTRQRRTWQVAGHRQNSPGYPPGLAGQLLSPGSRGTVSEPVPAAPFLGPSIATWPNPQPLQAGQSLPRKGCCHF